MLRCKDCGDEYDPDSITKSGSCRFCERKGEFAALAESCGLKQYPDPTGERYVYNLDGSCAGKKGECIDLIDALWDALVKLRGREDLIIGE